MYMFTSTVMNTYILPGACEHTYTNVENKHAHECMHAHSYTFLVHTSTPQ
jgi:hypothetical protein